MDLTLLSWSIKVFEFDFSPSLSSQCSMIYQHKMKRTKCRRCGKETERLTNENRGQFQRLQTVLNQETVLSLSLYSANRLYSASACTQPTDCTQPQPVLSQQTVFSLSLYSAKRLYSALVCTQPTDYQPQSVLS